ncbi:pyridoxal phosphate-dependent aminotransferase [Bdellovibrionota bacterium FG-2]
MQKVGAPAPSPAQSRISSRLDGIHESATLRLNALVQAMKARGEDVINLTAGEPDFDVPEPAKAAVLAGVRAGHSKYTAVAGIPALRAEIARKTTLVQGVSWNPSHVIVTNGAKQALYNAFITLLEPGDEVLIPSPYWLSYPEMVKLAGGIPKFLPTLFEQGFKLTADKLRQALGPRVKAIIFNSPSNPTGALYTRDEFHALGQILEDSGVWIISDEIYDRIVFAPSKFCSFLAANPGLQDRTVTINGVSKSAAMTGWRVGWSVAPQDVTDAMSIVQGQCTSGVNALAQDACLAALEIAESEFMSQVERFKARRDLVLEILSKTRKLRVVAPQGAFYVFASVAECLKPGEDASLFAERLLSATGVAVMSGSPFGEPEYIRLSFATDEQTLKIGCERLVRFLETESGRIV